MSKDKKENITLSEAIATGAQEQIEAALSKNPIVTEPDICLALHHAPYDALKLLIDAYEGNSWKKILKNLAKLHDADKKNEILKHDKVIKAIGEATVNGRYFSWRGNDPIDKMRTFWNFSTGGVEEKTLNIVEDKVKSIYNAAQELSNAITTGAQEQIEAALSKNIPVTETHVRQAYGSNHEGLIVNAYPGDRHKLLTRLAFEDFGQSIFTSDEHFTVEDIHRELEKTLMTMNSLKDVAKLNLLISAYNGDDWEDILANLATIDIKDTDDADKKNEVLRHDKVIKAIGEATVNGRYDDQIGSNPIAKMRTFWSNSAEVTDETLDIVENKVKIIYNAAQELSDAIAANSQSLIEAALSKNPPVTEAHVRQAYGSNHQDLIVEAYQDDSYKLLKRLDLEKRAHSIIRNRLGNNSENKAIPYAANMTIPLDEQDQVTKEDILTAINSSSNDVAALMIDAYRGDINNELLELIIATDNYSLLMAGLRKDPTITQAHINTALNNNSVHYEVLTPIVRAYKNEITEELLSALIASNKTEPELVQTIVEQNPAVVNESHICLALQQSNHYIVDSLLSAYEGDAWKGILASLANLDHATKKNSALQHDKVAKAIREAALDNDYNRPTSSENDYMTNIRTYWGEKEGVTEDTLRILMENIKNIDKLARKKPVFTGGSDQRLPSFNTTPQQATKTTEEESQESATTSFNKK